MYSPQLYLLHYTAALRLGWSPSNTRRQLAQEEVLAVKADAGDYLRWMHDPEDQVAPVILASGQQVPRLPGPRRWLWADEADLQHAGTHADAPGCTRTAALHRRHQPALDAG